MNKPVLIMGVGNILLRDEAVGVRVVEALRAMDLGDEIDVVDGGTSGADMVDEIAHRRRLIVVDAMKADEPPGTVYRMGFEDLLQNERSISLHEFGLVETLLMARHLNCYPAEVVIFGVQPAEIRMDLELSPEVRKVIPRLIEIVLAEARRPLPAETSAGDAEAQSQQASGQGAE